MSVHHPHLRKVLHLSMLRGGALDRELRKDIGETLRREDGNSGGGPDFHSPFWADAKAFVFSDADLRAATEERIERNERRERLYRLLVQRFLGWWTPFRASRNEPIRPFQEELRGSFILPPDDTQVKIQNLLNISAGANYHRFIYPYFTEGPALNDEVAAFGLAGLREAFPDYDPDCFVILDILRSRDYRFSNTDVPQDSLEQLGARYQQILRRWGTLRLDYD